MLGAGKCCHLPLASVLCVLSKLFSSPSNQSESVFHVFHVSHWLNLLLSPVPSSGEMALGLHIGVGLMFVSVNTIRCQVEKRIGKHLVGLLKNLEGLIKLNGEFKNLL
jgi:hypothetical protein